MLTEPHALVGSPIFWEPVRLLAPFGTILAAVCPSEPPLGILSSFHSDEIRLSEEMAPHRRREWLAGRLCLSRALAEHLPSPGRPALLPRSSGAPQVPAGTTGSISHKGPLAVAIAMSGNAAVGIDVECAEQRDARMARRVLTSTELTMHDDTSLVVAMHFAAKEAIYKSLQEHVQPDIDFEDIELDMRHAGSDWKAIPSTVKGYAPGAIELAVMFRGTWILAVARRDNSASGHSTGEIE